MANVLPDSRVKNPKNTVLVDWTYPQWVLGDGVLQRRRRRVRLEMEQLHCPNCGTPGGWVPMGLLSWVSFMCTPCAEKWGADALLHDVPDKAFWDKVGEEMERTYGKRLTQEELDRLAAQGQLSPGLQLLERESPYKKALAS